MKMSLRARMIALITHVTTSVGLLGGIATFLALAIFGIASQDVMHVRAAYIGTELVVWAVVLPLGLAALATGIIQALGTSWGLFCHYWIVAKLLITTFAIAVLLVQLKQISGVARAVTEGIALSPDLRHARISMIAHAAGGLIVLLVPVVLSLYKPGGLTPYGARKRMQR